MTDRELLELAAKAAGFKTKTVDNIVYVLNKKNPKDDWRSYDPLNDDGDALRLAVKLEIDIEHRNVAVAWVEYQGEKHCIVESYNDDPCSATRRAITRAAAEIGAQQ